MKNLPIGISNFHEMITDNFIYIDKTNIIHELFLKSKRRNFLARPRRFGKSLLVSLLGELFAGNKELFKDTWIYSSDYHWKNFPVLKFDFSKLSTNSEVEFKKSLLAELFRLGKNIDIDLAPNQDINSTLIDLITSLAKKEKVVLLIDEYDYPLLHNLDKMSVATEIRDTLASFFAVIKSVDGAGLVHSVFITGVTKFAKTTLFSGMNNLIDLTIIPEASTLLGYTKEELKNYFGDYIQQFAQKQNVSINTMMNLIKEQYNGYRFSAQEETVYNPYSALLSLDQKNLLDYWVTTGAPTFLIKLMQEQYQEIKKLDELTLEVNDLETFSLEHIDIIPVMFQAGYLTIKKYLPEHHQFALGFPNLEVKKACSLYINVSSI